VSKIPVLVKKMINIQALEAKYISARVCEAGSNSRYFKLSRGIMREIEAKLKEAIEIEDTYNKITNNSSNYIRETIDADSNRFQICQNLLVKLEYKKSVANKKQRIRREVRRNTEFQEQAIEKAIFDRNYSEACEIQRKGIEQILAQWEDSKDKSSDTIDYQKIFDSVPQQETTTKTTNEGKNTNADTNDMQTASESKVDKRNC
jgi:uncharacterized protein YjaZ